MEPPPPSFPFTLCRSRQSFASEPLTTGVVRLAAGKVDIARLEQSLLRNVRKYAHSTTESRVEMDGRHPELCRRVVVPAELKWEVRDKLSLASAHYLPRS